MQKFEAVEELKQRIIQENRLITPDMLRNFWRELDRLDICRATTGADFKTV